MSQKVIRYEGVMEIKINQDIDKNKDLPKKETAKRNEITRFTKKSRKRLFNNILKLEKRIGYFFVTLTYPSEYSKDCKVWHHQLDRLYCSLRYHYPKMGFLWKLEFQQRGAPHFHLLLFEPSNPPEKELYSLINRFWYNIVAQKSKAFRYYGTDVKAVKDIKTSGFYLAMYQTKDSYIPLDLKIGRIWGIKGAKNMPNKEQSSKMIDNTTYKILKRIVRKWMFKQKTPKDIANI